MKPVPYNVENSEITFKSNDKNILDIDKFGKLTAKNKGKTTISISLANGADGLIEKNIAVNVLNPTTEIVAPMIQTDYHREDQSIIYHKSNDHVRYMVNGVSPSANITWSSTNSNVELKPIDNNFACEIKLLPDVETKIKAEINDGSNNYVLERDVVAVDPILGLQFDNQYKSYGILDIYTVGDTEIKNGQYVDSAPFKLFETKDKDFSEFKGLDNIIFDSNKDVVDIRYDNGFKINIKQTDVTTISASWKYADYYMEKSKAEMKVKFVKDGVNVSNFDDLYKATNDAKPVVLHDDIKLFRENMSLQELKSSVGYMKTTSNWQYYLNVALDKGLSIDYNAIRPEVMYTLEFKNDVYGNGYTISNNNITTATYEDYISDNRIYKPFYNGPLDFVSMTANEEMSAASVKGQDNISFLVRTNNVIIDNVQLKSCDDEYLIENNNMNLSKLNKVGTTLEIMADDVIIKNSRISNGRTVIRAYGGKDTNGAYPGTSLLDNLDKINAADERIDVTITNSIVKNGREFLIKIGSNRAIFADTKFDKNKEIQDIKPLLQSNGKPYKPGNLNEKENRKEFEDSVEPDLKDDYFYNKYVTTDVTVNDCILENSGLFSIGVETNFSGPFLQGINDKFISGILGSLLPTWHDLAATSYASVLRLTGKVEILDWKELANLNSDTLIESDAEGMGEFLKLDFVAMIDQVRKNNSSYNNLIEMYDGKEYVHGGIAFYGGGFNYSLIDKKLEQDDLQKYNINLSILAEGSAPLTPTWMQGTALPLAAGIEDFTFYMYGSDGKSSCKNVKERIQNGSAYSWLKGIE